MPSAVSGMLKLDHYMLNKYTKKMKRISGKSPEKVRCFKIKNDQYKKEACEMEEPMKRLGFSLRRLS